MSSLKRYFVSPYAMALFIATCHSGYMLVSEGLGTAWLGAFIATAPGAIFFGRIMLTSVARTSDHTPVLWISGIIGTIVAFILPANSITPLAYAMVIGLIAGLLYDFWYSRYGGRDTSVLSVGKSLPDFNLYFPDGKALSSAEIKRSPALILFYRGN